MLTICHGAPVTGYRMLGPLALTTVLLLGASAGAGPGQGAGASSAADAPAITGLDAPATTGVDASAGAETTVLAVAQPTGDARPSVETVPVAHSGDAADDPAIWRDPVDPSRSIVIGNDKLGALEVYDLTGTRLQRFTGGFYGNVDTRTAVATGAGPIDVAVAYRLGVRVYKIDPGTRRLSNVTDATSGSIASPIGGEGLCLYRSPATGTTYAFVNARDGRIAQVALGDADRDGLVEGSVVRQWDVGSEVEGCVADDELGHLYVSEEQVAIWKYDAEPTGSTTARVAVDRPIADGGHLRPDAEGLTIVYQPEGTGYLIASSQAASDTANSYLVYDRAGGNAFVRELKVVTNAGVADGCGRTDGIDALAADLGPAFPHGVFICQDNANTAPGTAGNQNFKLVPLEQVVGLTEVDPGPGSSIATVGAVRAGANSTTYRVTVPSSVRAGDRLLLTLATNTTATITGPGGWTVVDSLETSGGVAQVWTTVADAGDAGSVVEVRVARISKADLALVAYRGASTPVLLAWSGVVDAPGRSAHATPLVAAPAGARVVSWWTHKDSTSTVLTPPTGVTVLTSGTQSGSGTVKSLMADAASPGGTAGGLVATAGATSSSATAWTIVLGY